MGLFFWVSFKFEVFGLRVWGLGLQGSPVGPSTQQLGTVGLGNN